MMKDIKKSKVQRHVPSQNSNKNIKKKNKNEVTKKKEKDVKGGALSRALNAWVYAIAKTSYLHGIQDVLFRETENESAYIYFRMRKLKVPKAKNALEACKTYVELLDKEGFLKKEDFEFHEKNGKVYVTIGGKCPYKVACEMMYRDGIPVVCARAASFSVATDLGLGKMYGTVVEKFKPNEKCRVVVELPL